MGLDLLAAAAISSSGVASSAITKVVESTSLMSTTKVLESQKLALLSFPSPSRHCANEDGKENPSPRVRGDVGAEGKYLGGGQPGTRGRPAT